MEGRSSAYILDPELQQNWLPRNYVKREQGAGQGFAFVFHPLRICRVSHAYQVVMSTSMKVAATRATLAAIRT